MSLDDGAVHLACPTCDRSLETRSAGLRCSACSTTVPIRNGIPRFPVAGLDTTSQTIFDAIAGIYETPIWFPAIYRTIGGPLAPPDDRRRVLRLLELSGGCVLDVACGTGRFSRYVASAADCVWGIDVSDSMLETARQKAGPDVTFARMDATDLRFDEASFDAVACCWALHLVPAVRETLLETNRVLESGGRFAGVTLTDAYLFELPGMKPAFAHHLDATVFETDEFRTLLQEAGFASVEFDTRGGALFFGATA